MRNLFVIGNGFDLAHNMKTGFNHFRDYLSTNYSILHSYAPPYVPETITGHHEEELQDTTEVVGLIAYLLDEAAADTGKCFDNVEPQYDKEGDRIYSWEYEMQNLYAGIWHEQFHILLNFPW